MSEPAESLAPEWSSTDWRVLFGLLALQLLVVLPYALRGPNFVLDDFWILEQGVFDGVFGASDAALTAARPGTAIAYGLTFGAFGNHPLPIFLIQAAIVLGCVAVLFPALRRFLSTTLAGATTAVWIVLPNHLSLEVWVTTSIIALSLLFLLVGVWAAARRNPSRLMQGISLAAFGLSIAFYEASVPLACLLIFAVPVIVERRVRWGYLFLGAGVVALQSLWLVLHWHDVKDVSTELADVTQIVPAHFGWGIVGTGVFASVLVGLAGAGILIVLVRVIRARAVTGPGEAMVLVGLVVMVVGTAPFATYFYAPLGAGDRFNYLSSIGGALVWVGLAVVLWAYRELVVVAAAAILVAAMITRWERIEIWDQAGDDGVAIIAAVREQIAEPDDTIAVGPEPIQRQNVAAFIDHSNIRGALAVAYGDRSTKAVMTFDQETFESFDPDHRVDIRPHSRLQPDSVVEPSG